ncbi:DUF1491 family protein [Sphingobium sufflavum]|uniref:DUF1491 family protein n=1 Tax=Sphingobium sufflavum TaxID=1129547 RepID=UPI001F1B1A17|nr:DUF1491 family protein [Sphingobium sufflavum]MCE7795062.1 DUF1491 family protein [Sphingobium sufflavum]
MTGRLPAKTLVSALIRRVNQAGGFASVLASGEDMGGMILVQTLERGRFSGFFERMTDLDGRASLVRCGPPVDSDPPTLSAYLNRRRSSDPDLWIVELDIVDAERFAAETIAMG